MKKFSINQKVKIYDDYEFEWFKGKVTEVGENFVCIQWDDISSPCKHLEDEFDLIFIIE